MPGRTRSRRDMPPVVEGDLAGDLGPRSDQAHVAEQDVEELRQLVDGVAAQPLARLGDPRVVLHLEQQGALAELALQLGDQGLGVDDHGAELEAAELLAVAPDPGLAEEDRAAVVGLDPDRGEDEERAEGEDAGRAEPHTSKSRLPQRDASVAVGGSMCISGRPPTGRTRIRSLEMSVTLGATTTWTFCVLEVPDDPSASGPRSRASRRRRRSRRRRSAWPCRWRRPRCRAPGCRTRSPR